MDADRAADRRLATAVVALAFLFNFVARGVADSFAAFLLPLEAEFGWSRGAMTGVFATALLTSGLVAPVAGRVFDRLGPRVAYCGGLALLAAGAALASRTSEPWHLYASAGVVVGLATAALGMVSATTLIGRWHRRHLSTAIAIAYAGMGSGMLVTMPLVQALIERDGWRSAWQTVALVVLALVVPCALLPWRRLGRGPGAAGGADGAPGPAAASARPAPSRGPTLVQALRTREYRLLVQSFFFTSFASYLVTPQTVAFLVESGFPPITAATAYGAAGLLSTVGVIAVGWLCGRLGYGPTTLASYASTALGLLALLALTVVPSPALLVAWVACFGLVQGSRGPVISTLTNRLFAGASAGTIYGTVYLSMALGAAAGSIAGGALHDLTGGYRVLLGLSLATLALAAAPFRRGSPILRDVDRGR